MGLDFGKVADVAKSAAGSALGGSKSSELKLEKAVLINTASGESLPIEFNPSEYTISRKAVFFEDVGLYTSTSYVNFSGIHRRQMETSLFFDTTDSGEDVSEITKKLEAFMDLVHEDNGDDIDPVLIFKWSAFEFVCVLEDLTEQFIKFTADGIPLRVICTCVFSEYLGPHKDPPVDSSAGFASEDLGASLAAGEIGGGIPETPGLSVPETPDLGDLGASAPSLGDSLPSFGDLEAAGQVNLGNMAGAVPDVGGMASGALGDVTGKLQGAVPDVGGMASGALGDAAGKLQGAVPDVGGMASGALGDAAGKLQGAVPDVGGMASGAADKLKGDIPLDTHVLDTDMFDDLV